MRKSRKYTADQGKKDLRINGRIRAPRVRLIMDGGTPEIVDHGTALERAKSLGLDLVEVSPTQSPPVCRIIDYGKYKFEQKKRKREQSRNQHNFVIKEIKIRPKIATHDYDLKKRNAEVFLQHGDKVKVTVRFRGREITHPEIGMDLMQRMVQDLKEVSVLEVPARQEGKQINMVLAPQPGTGKRKVQKKELAPKAPPSKSVPAEPDSA